MNKLLNIFAIGALCFGMAACGDDKPSEPEKPDQPDQPVSPDDSKTGNVARAMQIVDAAVDHYMEGVGMSMARYYNPFTSQRSSETGSVWMYTSAIEAVNAVMKALDTQKAKGDATLYNANFDRYKTLMSKLYDGLDYYSGSYTLTSYTQTKSWTVYAVNRAGSPGAADVSGVLNVYDDQMWLVRELIEAYKLTGETKYLDKAEYLTAYVLDGWDCTLDANGNENGGITWGPGYFTKHSCSNGPMVSPLVWLSEIYKGKGDQVTYRYIGADKKRLEKTENKSDYYLHFAKAVYDWQKSHLLIPESGVYDDMMGGGNAINYEEVDGVRYRANTPLPDRCGPAITYNSGTMLSGAADLYAATGDNVYLEDLKALSDNSFKYFAKPSTSKKGYYEWDLSGFRTWFNGVLMRAYAEAYQYHNTNADYLDAFQKSLDYGYDNYLKEGMLPTNLLLGWNRDKSKNNSEGMFQFTYGAEFAVLATYELNKN